MSVAPNKATGHSSIFAHKVQVDAKRRQAFSDWASVNTWALDKRRGPDWALPASQPFPDLYQQMTFKCVR